MQLFAIIIKNLFTGENTLRETTYFFNSKGSLRLLRAFLIFIFVMSALFPVSAFASENGKTEQKVSILDKDNYYTDEEKEDLVEEIRKEKFLPRKWIIYVSPLKDETSKSLSYQEMIDKEYPELEVDKRDYAVIAPWLEGKNIGVNCGWYTSAAYYNSHTSWRCFYMENPKGAKSASFSEKISYLKKVEKNKQIVGFGYFAVCIFFVVILVILTVLKVKEEEE